VAREQAAVSSVAREQGRLRWGGGPVRGFVHGPWWWSAAEPAATGPQE
jgi:hypothetical protein